MGRNIPKISRHSALVYGLLKPAFLGVYLLGYITPEGNSVDTPWVYGVFLLYFVSQYVEFQKDQNPNIWKILRDYLQLIAMYQVMIYMGAVKGVFPCNPFEFSNLQRAWITGIFLFLLPVVFRSKEALFKKWRRTLLSIIAAILCLVAVISEKWATVISPVAIIILLVAYLIILAFDQE